jgi:hypothetical protein
MARNDPEFKLRMPEKLRDEIVESAKKSGRSINAEIVARLQNSLGWDQYDPADLARGLDEVERDVARIIEVLRENGLMR